MLLHIWYKVNGRRDGHPADLVTRSTSVAAVCLRLLAFCVSSCMDKGGFI